MNRHPRITWSRYGWLVIFVALFVGQWVVQIGTSFVLTGSVAPAPVIPMVLIAALGVVVLMWKRPGGSDPGNERQSGS